MACKTAKPQNLKRISIIPRDPSKSLRRVRVKNEKIGKSPYFVDFLRVCKNAKPQNPKVQSKMVHWLKKNH